MKKVHSLSENEEIMQFHSNARTCLKSGALNRSIAVAELEERGNAHPILTTEELRVLKAIELGLEPANSLALQTLRTCGYVSRNWFTRKWFLTPAGKRAFGIAT